MKKNVFLVLIVLSIALCDAVAQDKVMIKLTKSQIKNMAISRSGTQVTVAFRNTEIDKLLSRFRFSSFSQGFPLAQFFKHPASERVNEYYTLEGDF